MLVNIHLDSFDGLIFSFRLKEIKAAPSTVKMANPCRLVSISCEEVPEAAI